MSEPESRYSRQIRFAPIGPEGQKRIENGRLLIVGCGALGSNMLNLLVRAGVGFIRVVDSDAVELSNLPRQVMFGEEDVKSKRPKAIAGANYAAKINSDVVVEPVVMRVDKDNILPLCDGVDLVLDGTDNFEIRYLMNDACLKLGLPWIYGGVVGASGASMNFLPGGPCLRCIWPKPPDPENTPNTFTHGVVNAAPALVATIQATEAIKYLIGQPLRETLWNIELWQGTSASIRVGKNAACPACGKGKLEFLE